MPTYLYLCSNCGHEFEEYLPVDKRDLPLGPCKKCSEISVRRVVGNNGGFRLGTKGSVSWAAGGYSTTLGDARIAEAK